MSDTVNTLNAEELVDWQAEWDAATPDLEVAHDAEQELAHYVRVQTALESEMDRLTLNYPGQMERLAKRKAWYEQTYGSRAQEACHGLLRGKSKSVKTLYGTAGFRARGELLVVEDEERVLAAAAAGMLPVNVTRITTSVSKEALNALYSSTGEVPDGCTVRPAGDVFYVR